MAKLVPYVFVKNSLAAIEVYKKVFEAEVVDHNKFTPEVGKSMGLPDDFDYEKSTMHAELRIYGDVLYMADTIHDSEGRKMDILLNADSREQVEGIYKRALDNGFKASMELQETFWGALFASMTDPFGIGWQLNFQLEKE